MGDNNFSVGVYIEEVSRFDDLSQNVVLLKKIFTQKELDYCMGKDNPSPHLAVRFAAKEAVFKALSSLGRDINVSDVEVCKNASGTPFINVFKYNDIEFKLSLSHTNSTAIAFVVAAINNTRGE